MSIADNLLRVRERIAAAAESVGRRAEEITLVGVTKYVGARAASELVAAGCHDLGESRPQELWAKFDTLHSVAASLRDADSGQLVAETFLFSHPRLREPRPQQIRWHLVGHLQRNKVRRTLPLVTLIHSVDSERLLAAIDGAAQAEIAGGRSQPVNVLLEVNTSGEAAKHGLAPDDVQRLLDVAPCYPRVYILGLMTMAALESDPKTAARNFSILRELRDRLQPHPPNCVLNELSMGMSGDFEAAIREGATIVRIGSLLWE